VSKVSEFDLWKHIADWLSKEIPGAVKKAVQDVGGLKWAGPYVVGQSYTRGDMCRLGSSLWVALKDTSSTPGQMSPDWDFML